MCKSAPLRAAEEGVFVKGEGNEDAGIGPIWEVDGGIWGEKKKKKSFKEFLFGLDDRLFVALVGKFLVFLLLLSGWIGRRDRGSWDCERVGRGARWQRGRENDFTDREREKN
jgi:hypothetical protein